jgi:hypothetical protein
MRIRGVFMAVVVAAITVSPGWSRPGAGITISGGTPAQRAMARWAVGRYVAAGLSLPQLDIRFHESPDGCEKRLGYYAGGVASLCGTHVSQMARRTLLHELAHGWLASNLTDAARARFLRARGLWTWNDGRVPWERRGFEQGAEIISWALHDQGTGILLPSIPDHAPEQLSRAYVLLTGRSLPDLAATSG